MPIIGEPFSTQSWKLARPEMKKMPSAEKKSDRRVNVSPVRKKRRRAPSRRTESPSSPAGTGGGVVALLMGEALSGEKPRFRARRA